MEHVRVETGGVTLHCVAAGSGPLLVLLHGFPESSYAWRRQMPGLAAAGFRVVAPDLRGYGESDRPKGVAAYRVQALVDDVAGLIERLGMERAVVVGHDWGGVVAWYTAMLRPERVRRLVVLNAPHPAAYARELRRGSSQLWRSWYAGMHQLPWLPERAWQAFDHALLRKVLGGGPARTRAEEDVYVDAFSRPGGMTPALNYYRAAVRHGAPRATTVRAPTLLVWGERDRYLVPELTLGLERWVPELRIQRLSEAGHWVHHEEAERVTALISAFAAEGETAIPPAPE